MLRAGALQQVFVLKAVHASIGAVEIGGMGHDGHLPVLDIAQLAAFYAQSAAGLVPQSEVSHIIPIRHETCHSGWRHEYMSAMIAAFRFCTRGLLCMLTCICSSWLYRKGNHGGPLSCICFAKRQFLNWLCLISWLGLSTAYPVPRRG